MPSIINDRFLKALHRQPVDRTPIWIMRQAGRYLPEYRKVRQNIKHFMALCKNPELACEVTMQPLERFDLDAAILFSDILTIPDAMGLELSFTAGEGPRFAKPVRDEKSIRNLSAPDPELELGYVMDAVSHIKSALQQRIPLIGFSGSPWTLATYMVEGGSSKNFSLIKGMMYREPQTLHRLLTTLARAVTDYLNAQIAAGVDCVMLFDTWGGVLSFPCYQQFSLQYMQHIIEGIKAKHGDSIPTILFTKNGGQWLEAMAETGVHGLGLDWTTDMAQAKQRVGQQVCLQGNLDPNVLYADADTIRREVKDILNAFGNDPGHIFNLGHGIHPQVNPDNVAILVDAVHEMSQRNE